MPNLHGRTALVTGSSQGIGRAIAISLAKSGANLVLHGLKRDAAAEASIAACREFDVRVSFVEGDLAAPNNKAANRIAAEANELEPSIDLLVNNAGGYFDVPFLQMDADIFEKTMHLNVFAYFYLTQWFARRWVEQQTPGRVLMIGSINGRLAEATHVAYDTSKGAVEMMVKSLCCELAPHGVRVNGIAPGLFYTPLTAPALDDAAARQWMESHTPNGKVPGPEVVGDAAVFLLSDGAEHIHGQMLLVDGGMSAWQQPPPPNSN